MFADGKKKTLQAMFQTQAPKPPKIFSYKNNLPVINKQSMHIHEHANSQHQMERTE